MGSTGPVKIPLTGGSPGSTRIDAVGTTGQYQNRRAVPKIRSVRGSTKIRAVPKSRAVPKLAGSTKNGAVSEPGAGQYQNQAGRLSGRVEMARQIEHQNWASVGTKHFWGNKMNNKLGFLISFCIGCIAANFLYQGLGAGEYDHAAERSFFQVFALVSYYWLSKSTAHLKIKAMINGVRVSTNRGSSIERGDESA